MGAFEYVAVDPGGKNRKGVLEGDTPRQVRQLLRERNLLPVKITEIAEKAPRSGGGIAPVLRRRCRHECPGPGLDDAAARHAVPLGAPARGGPAGGGRAVREGQGEDGGARGALESDGRSHARERPGGLPAGVSGNLPRHRGRWRAVRPPGCGARAPRRLHREPTRAAAEDSARHGVPDHPHPDGDRHRHRLAGLRCTAGGRGVRQHQPGTAPTDENTDRCQRLAEGKLAADPDPAGIGGDRVPAGAQAAGISRGLPPLPADAAHRRPAGARREHRSGLPAP
jgi:hypothetical protein